MWPLGVLRCSVTPFVWPPLSGRSQISAGPPVFLFSRAALAMRQPPRRRLIKIYYIILFTFIHCTILMLLCSCYCYIMYLRSNRGRDLDIVVCESYERLDCSAVIYPYALWPDSQLCRVSCPIDQIVLWSDIIFLVSCNSQVYHVLITSQILNPIGYHL